MLQGVELYNHSLAPVPNSFDMEHANIAQAPAAASLVLELHDMLHRQFTKPWSSAMKSDDGGSAAAPLRPKPPYRGWAFGSNLTNQELYPPGAALPRPLPCVRADRACLCLVQARSTLCR